MSHPRLDYTLSGRTPTRRSVPWFLPRRSHPGVVTSPWSKRTGVARTDRREIADPGKSHMTEDQKEKEQKEQKVLTF